MYLVRDEHLIGILSKWGHHLDSQQRNQSSCWVCGQPPLSSLLELPRWVCMLQGGDLKVLKQYIREEQTTTSTPNSSDVANTDPEAWPVVHAINHTRYSYSFPVNRVTRTTVKLLMRRVLKTPSEPWMVMLGFGIGSCGSLEKEMATHSSVLAWRIPRQRSLVDCRLWGRTKSDTTEVT